MLDEVLRLCEQASVAVLKVYSGAFDVTRKEDHSPLTEADRASHRILFEGLSALGSYPVLSEEGAVVPFEQRRNWKEFWLIDPLDGTKEFIQKNGDFTINVALIRDGRPVLGVVYVPVRAEAYLAEKDGGAMKRSGGSARSIHVDSGPTEALKVVASRLHRGPELDRYLGTLGNHEEVSVGSSLKFCLVAEGAAHLYPRFLPTMEWDTAAADCVLTESGGYVEDLQGEALRYNKESLLNPSFIAGSVRPVPGKVAA